MPRCGLCRWDSSGSEECNEGPHSPDMLPMYTMDRLTGISRTSRVRCLSLSTTGCNSDFGRFAERTIGRMAVTSSRSGQVGGYLAKKQDRRGGDPVALNSRAVGHEGRLSPDSAKFSTLRVRFSVGGTEVRGRGDRRNPMSSSLASAAGARSCRGQLCEIERA